MKHPVLTVQNREILGKKVKQLRRDGLLPANIYGKEMKSTPVQISSADFTTIYRQVGETGIIDVTLDGKAHPALIKNLQWNYQTHTPLHVDFFKVNLKEKIKAMIPLTLIGESLAVKDNLGTLLAITSEVEVESLPEALPDHIDVDISVLANVNDQILVSEITIPDDVTIVGDASQIVAKIAELVAPEPEPVVEEVVAEGEEAGSTSETVEGSEQATATE